MTLISLKEQKVETQMLKGEMISLIQQSSDDVIIDKCFDVYVGAVNVLDSLDLAIEIEEMLLFNC